MHKLMFYSLSVYLGSSPILQNVLFIYVFDRKAASLVYILKVRISDWHCLDIIKKMPVKVRLTCWSSWFGLVGT